MDLLKRHSSLLAALAAAYAVWRYGRYLALGWLQVRNLPFVDGPLRFLLGHWELAAVLGALIFVGVFGAVRYALDQGTPDRSRGLADGGGEPLPGSPSQAVAASASEK